MANRTPASEEFPLLLTKIQVPRRPPGVLRRARLVERLHQNLHRRLTFVTAPAGFGKTTLLVDFAAEAPARVGWYHITAEDRDLRRFVRYLAGAFLQVFPQMREVFADLLEGVLPAQNPVALAGWLNNLLAEHVDDFTLLVIDDYHLVGEQQEVVDFVEAWLEHLPDQVRLLIASRSVYGIPTTRLYLRNELGLIGPEDLRFTAEELRALARLAYDVDLPLDYATDLAARTDGWIIAMLLAIRLRTEGNIPLIHGEREELYAFLAEEVLRHLPAYLVDFLLKTSLFDEFDAPLCQEVLQEPKAAAYLREVENRNLFVTRVDTREGAVYRYHQLFADFLQSRLQAEAREGRVALHARAARWFWERGDVERAVAHRLAAGDREGAAEWMDAAAREAFLNGHLELLAQWVATLEKPVDLRPRAPRLLLYHAKALGNQQRFADSDALLALARPVLEQQHDDLLWANLLEAQGLNAYMQRDYARAAQLARSASEALSKLGEGLWEKALRFAQSRRVEALAIYYLGQRREALKKLEGVVHDLRALGGETARERQEKAYNLAMVLQDLGVLYFQEGRLGDALRAFSEVRDLWREHHLNPVEFPAVLNNLAFLYHRSGQQEMALRTYLEAADAARKQGSPNLAAVLSGIGEIYYEEERWEEAHKTFQEALAVARQSQSADFLAAAHRGMAKLWAARGQFAMAFEHLRQAAVLLGRSEESAWYAAWKGRLYWLLGDDKAALAALLPLLEPRDESLLQEDEARILLLTAALLADQGETERPLRLLQRALEMVAHLGYVHFLRVEARRLQAFFRQMSARLSHPVLEELVRLGQPPLALALEAPQQVAWPPLVAHGFGVGEVWLGEARISRAAWRAMGARALFFFILDRGPVRKEEIALAFWPDFSLAKVNSNLHATLWRVRRALGDKHFIQVEEGRYRLHPNLQVRYDVATFEQLLQEAARLTEVEKQRGLLAEAVRLYRGDFLEDMDFPWVSDRRYELQRRYGEALAWLIEDAMRRRAWREALTWLEPALATEPYNDRWHLYRLQCLAAMGKPSRARAYYRDYRRRLKKELGVEPDEALQRFVESLG
ncbi:MAG TPA: tetratricopeptide repeat protein [Chloroflexi bacterium]|nr:tetratricopeptide repeat protein [Chloroflexota bacterium]